MAGRDGRRADLEARLEAAEADRFQMEEVLGGPEATWDPAELAEAGVATGHPAFEA